MSQSANNDSYVGALQPQAQGDDFNAFNFMISQQVNKIATSALVEVVSVTNSGGVSPIGTMSVRPLVNQVDGQGNSTSHGVINGIPYQRMQGGTSGIIIDPAKGDIGWCNFFSRDTSGALANGAASNPGSSRKFDWADAVYVGRAKAVAPIQYIQFTDAGVKIFSPGAITFIGSNATLDASGNLTCKGDVVANGGSASVSLANHLTSQVTSGPEMSGPPVPGT